MDKKSSPVQDAGQSRQRVGGPVTPLGVSATQESNTTIPQERRKSKPKRTALDKILDKAKNGRVDPQKAMEEMGGKSFSKALDSGLYALDAKDMLYRVNPDEHIDNRENWDVGERRLKAFQYDHPEIHPYFAQAAGDLLDELSLSERGGEVYKKTGRGVGDDVYLRTKRLATDRIAYLLDDQSLTYDDIERALNAIVADDGQENFAAAKRVELLLDKMLTEGYRTAYGQTFAPNEQYIRLKQEIPGAAVQQDTAYTALDDLVFQKRTQSGKGEGNISYQIRQQFTQEIDQWARDGKPNGETFILGSTGSVLQGLGAIESDIYMESAKINKIFADHPEMTLDEIKKIPQILDDPALVLKSKNVGRSRENSRLVMFGLIKAKNGKPIMAVMDLRPRENGFLIDDMQKVNSTYTKSNPTTFFETSEVLYADKKRTVPLLRSSGLAITSQRLLRNGSMGSITYSGNKVNIKGVPFSKIVENDEKRFSMQERDSSGRELSQQQQEYFKDSQVRDSEGRLKPVFHATYDTFTVFDRYKLGAITDGNASDEYLAATAHIGFWFNENDLSKQAYGDRSEEVYLNITSPYDAETLDALAEEMKMYDGSAAEMGDGFARWLKREGYDGIVLRDTEFGGTSYVALDPNQIKRTGNQSPTDNSDIRYQERGTSNREILTTALESAAQNPREREVLAEYKAAADKLETYEARLRENRAKLQELTVDSEKQNAKRISKLKSEIRQDENRVNIVTGQLETMENRESLRALLARERFDFNPRAPCGARRQTCTNYAHSLRQFKQKGSAKTAAWCGLQEGRRHCGAKSALLAVRTAREMSGYFRIALTRSAYPPEDRFSCSQSARSCARTACRGSRTAGCPAPDP